MPFVGSIPGHVAAIVHEHVRRWGAPELYVGCSGGFTVEHAVADLDVRCHSNDVGLYSSALGAWLSGGAINAKLSVAGRDVFPWLVDHIRDRTALTASIMLSSQFAQFANGRTPYHRRMLAEYEAQWERLHAETVARIEASEAKVASYTPADVVEWLESVPDDAPFVCYPPFFGHAKHFRTTSQRLTELWDWPDAPAYELLDEERLIDFYRSLAKRRRWLFGANQPVEGLEKHLVSVSKRTTRGATIYVYARRGVTRVVQPHERTEPVLIPRLRPDEEVGREPSLAILTGAQFHTVRAQYMNHHIRPARMSGLPLAALVDGRLVGAFALVYSEYRAGEVYMLSDFPVAPSRHGRLAKLIVYAALSEEATLLAERTFSRRVRGVTTTAFSEKPVSMKYRGVMKLLKRSRNDSCERDWGADLDPNDPYYGRPYELIYRSDMPRWTLAEGLEEWRRKHGDT